jgi:copper transport protein
MRRARYLIPFLVVVAAAGSSLPATAWGHAAFLESQPAPGARLGASPPRITLSFTEPLNRGLTDVRLVDSISGEAIPSNVSAQGERQVVLQPQGPMPKAPYEVDWRTVSTVDGHTLEGSFSFGVQTAPVETEGSVEQGPLARDGWLRIGSRALLYAALFFFAGGVLNAALLTRRSAPGAWLIPDRVSGLLAGAGKDPDTAREDVWTRTLEVGWFALGAAVGVAVAEASDAGGGLSAHALSDFLLSNGTPGLARLGTVVAIAIAVILARSMRVAASAALAVAFLAISLSGHANSADPSSLAVLTDWIHLLAGAIWVGGIAQIAVAWLPAIRDIDRPSRLTVIGSVLDRFGRVALPAFLVVAATGSINALIQLGNASALWETSYGRVLTAKIALVGLIALASYGHALRLRPRLLVANPHPDPYLERRHWRLLAAEPWLALGVIVAVAALVAFPLPPRQLGEADEAAAAPCDPCPLPKAAGRQLPVAEQAGSRIAAFWLRRDGDELSGTVRLLDSNAGPVDAPVELDGGELEGCGVGCWRIAVTDPGSELTLRVEDQGIEHAVTVPSDWEPNRSKQAARLLARAQERMRGLRTLRMRESLTSGIRGYTVRTAYRYQAPDRIAYRTSTGTRLVAIGKSGYESIEGEPFRRRPFGADGFQFENVFRWTVYGRDVRWIKSDDDTAQIALYDEATPVWYRLTIDRSTHRVLRERMIAGGHFMSRRYLGFNQPVLIEPPR